MSSLNRMLFLLSLISTLFTATSCLASQHLVTPDFEVVRDAIDRQVEMYGPQNVLVVFDTDNTILATESDFGSEHWSLWQVQQIQNNAKDKIATNLPDLFTLQGWILGLASMHPVEKRIPTDIKQWNAQGVRSLVVTSRSINLHDATLREFDRNGFVFSFGGSPSTSTPFDLNHPEAIGINKADLKTLNITSVSPVRYERGILLTEGQHKGLMLKAFLTKSKQPIKSIIFIDDRSRHLDGVQAVFKNRVPSVVTIQYTHEAEHIAAFDGGDKSTVEAQWCAFSRGLKDSVFRTQDAATLPFVECIN